MTTVFAFKREGTNPIPYNKSRPLGRDLLCTLNVVLLWFCRGFYLLSFILSPVL